MNKTVNINLGGMFFHIDEDAYQKLNRYFEAIKRSLSNSAGQDEIIKDIEMRIAELVSEKHTHDKQVITLKELDEIIAVMGQPEDYRIEGEETDTPEYDYVNNTGGRRIKKLYRDPEKGMLGGVCSGLGHYFGVDAVWLRILFVVLLFGFGVGLIPYIVLWIVMPAAVTTAEKLEMMGEPVTISNIERKVREEAQNLAERFGKGNVDRAGKQVRTGFERAAGGIGTAVSSVFRAFAKMLGALIVVFAAIVLVGLLIGMFTLGSTSIIDVPWQPYLDAANYTDIPMWALALMIFLAVGIPVFSFFLLGLKLISSKVRSIGSVAKYTLVALWALSIAGVIIYVTKQKLEVAYDNKEVIKQPLNLASGDTLKIKFRYNDFYAKDIYRRHNYLFTTDENDAEVIYSNNVGLHIKYTDEPMGYIQIEKQAHGKTINEARQRAREIQYGFSIEGNQIILDNYMLIPKASKFRDQQVEIFVYLPKGTLLAPDSSVADFDWSHDWFFNLHRSGQYVYWVKPDKVYCLNCPPEEDDFEDLIITPDGIQIPDSASGAIRIEKLPNTQRIEIGPDGVLIKK